MSADLVVVGSRGHGLIATMVLGSTASEVVDHAPCPVLVARSGSLGSIAFADDGSASARAAEALITTWPIFAHRHVEVLTVAETGSRSPSASSPASTTRSPGARAIGRRGAPGGGRQIADDGAAAQRGGRGRRACCARGRARG